MKYIKDQKHIILIIDCKEIIKYINSLTQYLDHQAPQLRLGTLFDNHTEKDEQFELQSLISEQLISVLQDRHTIYYRVKFFIEKN